MITIYVFIVALLATLLHNNAPLHNALAIAMFTAVLALVPVIIKGGEV